MEHIAKTTQKLLKQWQDKRGTDTTGIIKKYLKALLTRQEYRHITNCFVRSYKLTLHIDSPTWLYMINLKKNSLLNELNQALGPIDNIREIFLQLENR